MNLPALANSEIVRWLPAVAILLLETSIIAALGLLIAGRFRRDPAAKHAILFTALLTLVAAPLLTAVCQRSCWTVCKVALPPAVSPPMTPASQWSSMERSPPRPPQPEVIPLAESPSHHDESAQITTVRQLTGPFDLQEPNPVVSPALFYCLEVWGLGVLLLSLRLIVGLVAVRRLLANTLPFTNPTVDKFLQKLPMHFGGFALPRIVVHDSLPTALATGIFSPTIILPRAFVETLTPEELTAVITHEASHLLRSDPLIGLLQRLVGAIFWPHPLVHLLNRGLSRAREEICDNFVLQQQPSASYAKLLFRLVQTPSTGRAYADVAPGWTISFLDPRWKLESRISGILDPQRKLSTRCRRPLPVLTALLLLLVVLSLAGIRTSFAQPQAVTAIAPATATDEEFDAVVQLSKMNVRSFGDLFHRWHHLEFIESLKKNRHSQGSIAIFEDHARQPVRQVSLSEVPETAWPLIGKLKSIETLGLGQLNMTDAAWANISQLPHLRDLSANGLRSTSAGVMQLKQATNLEVLSVSFESFKFNPEHRKALLGKLTAAESDQVAQARRKSPKTGEQSAEAAIFTDRLLEQLAPLKKLRNLRLINTSVSSRGVQALTQFQHLEQIEVEFPELNVADARLLTSLTSLKGVRSVKCLLALDVNLGGNPSRSTAWHADREMRDWNGSGGSGWRVGRRAG